MGTKIHNVLAALLIAGPAGANALEGDWHCLQEGPEARVEAEASFSPDGVFTAQMEYRFVRNGTNLRVTALYAATWRLDGAMFWDDPQDARITGTFVDGEPADLPELARSIRASLMEPPDSPMQLTFQDPDFMLLRGVDDAGTATPFQCVRLGRETDL